MWTHKNYLLLLLSLIAVAVINAQSKKGVRIVGGYATTIDMEPFAVQIINDDRFDCGGSIISAKWVLSAAHCTHGLVNEPHRFKVRVGETYKNGVTRNVLKIVNPGNYNPDNFDNDASMMMVDSLPLNGKTIRAIPLCSKAVPIGAQVKVSGWGRTTENGAFSDQLLSVYVTIISRQACRTEYNKYDLQITNSMICAYDQDKDSCQGDSGGAVVYNNEICGIVSWGVGCARPGFPGVYADVMKLKYFIENTMQNN